MRFGRTYFPYSQMKFKQRTTLLTCIAVFISAMWNLSMSQQVFSIQWQKPIIELSEDLNEVKKLYFDKAFYPDVDSMIPSFYCSDYLKGKVTKVDAQISQVITKKLTSGELALIRNQRVPSTLVIKPVIKQLTNQSLVQIFGNALINKEGSIHKVLSFEYKLEAEYGNLSSNLRTSSAGSTSDLSSGTWHKISVTNTGVHRLDKAFFSSIGVNVSTFNPRNIRIYGNSSGMLPESNQAPVVETLQETQIYVQGEGDGVFNDNDYVLFYGVGPHNWDFDESLSFFKHRQHLYSDTAYYFLNMDIGPGKRITSKSQSSQPSNFTVNSYDARQFHELDKTNLLKTGKRWLGEYFDLTTSYNHSFSFPDLITSQPISISAEYAVRSFVSGGSNLIMSVNGSVFQEKNNINSVATQYTNRYAEKVTMFGNINVGSSSIIVNSRYSKPQPSSVAWLDFITINGTSSLRFQSGQLNFRKISSIGPSTISKFSITSTSDLSIWDVTDPLKVQSQAHNFSGGQISFTAATPDLKEYLAYDGSSFFTPGFVKKVANQNLTGYLNKEYIVVCIPSFAGAAQELVDFHAQHDGLSGTVVTTEQIYNEFSSGAQDISAIRNYLKYLYENSNTKPKYLMLIGDGSYDYKNRTSQNTNIAPSFQSEESYHPLTSFTSDDFYGLLDDDKSILSNSATVDIGIGRAPVNTIQELNSFIAKVKNYEASTGQNTQANCSTTPSIKNTFGSWKNKLMFVADDGSESDGYSKDHLDQSELIIDKINEIDSSFNHKKIYLDSYEKVPSPSGGTYPDVTREINNGMNTGNLVVSYIGHGGEAGWADERILSINDILNWNHFDRLPLFLTATCEFSRFDDPDRTAAGEHVFLNPDGGAIALITTVRLVYGGISNNIGFAINFFNNTLPKNIQNTIGQGLLNTKNESPMGSSFNKRKFVLLGDPAVRLAVPEYQVRTAAVVDDSNATTDTLKALSKIKIKGEVQTEDGTFAANFNGVLYPTVYDVYKKAYTLDNNNKGRIDSFWVQNNILFKGKASVKQGKFEFEFIVPKDISYTYGEGKISYYIANQELEGSGHSAGIKIGGTSDNYAPDNTSPSIDLFLNDSNFVNGGLTNESPVLIAQISDVSGINTAGAGIGHDITATIDNNTSNPLVLNEYYEAKIDDYTGGTVTYPLRDLSEGTHTIAVKAWDIHNNSATQTLDFIVSNSSELALEHVLNYPNPFTTNTDFYFEHNHACSSMLVRIQIFTISGKLVKTILKTINGSGNLKGNSINWNGRDDYGDKLGKGVYIYKLHATSSDGLSANKIEKLVILN